MTVTEAEPIIGKNQALQNYYEGFESRIGYRLVLGGTRHFGYYKPGTYWPFSIGKALRTMEDKLIDILGLKEGSKVLDAGCGVGHVAIHLAQNGFYVQGIDFVEPTLVGFTILLTKSSLCFIKVSPVPVESFFKCIKVPNLARDRPGWLASAPGW